MKKMDSLGLKICSFQAELFEKSITDSECSTKIFIRRFMNSQLAKRMDNIGFLFTSYEISESFLEISEEYGESSYGIVKISSEELHWIGYIYRYWAYTSEKSSKELYKLVKPEYLKKVYFPYHSLDPAQAIERIKEELNIPEPPDYSDIARGVIALRKVRARRGI